MSLQKNITIEYGKAKVPVVCNYHTITSCYIDSSLLPEFDGNGDIVKDGNPSTLVISSFVDKATYDANRGSTEFAIRNKIYSVPLMVMYVAQRVLGTVTPEDQAYDYVQSLGDEFSDAQRVP